jgi:threonine dehydrogenase-like Zn-dependent dehydrogenase
MKAVVFHGVGDIRLDNVDAPKLQKPNDAIVRLTASAICGTDLHMIRGTITGMKPGTILGHEGVGIVEEVGTAVRNFKQGDRVVIGSTIACGNCAYCRAGFYSQCDNANPNGPAAGTAFFGGPETTGPFDGLQAEYARIPFANVGMVKLPDGVNDEQAILISDILPTAWFGAEMAKIEPGRSVAVFGCGPVGQFVIASAKLMDAGRIFAIDCIPSRLEMARDQGAEIIDFSKEDPVEVIKGFTGGIGADRVIDAVGVDAVSAGQDGRKGKPELRKVAPVTGEKGDNWHPGDSPSQALQWAVQAIAKAGTLAVIGVYPEALDTFPIGAAMEKNLRLNMGNCNHRKYIPKLVNMVRSGVIDPTQVLTQREPLTSAIDAYKQFDRRMPGWIKVKLEPAKAA